MVQSIHAHDGVMWVLRPSADGSMVATGGQDGVVRVWRVADLQPQPQAQQGEARGGAAGPSGPPPAPPRPPAGGLERSGSFTERLSFTMGK